MRTRPQHRAFTLVESLLAILILALAALALGHALTAGTAQALDARERVLATFVADQKLDEVLESNYSDLANEATTFPQPDGDFVYEITVSAATNHNLAIVSVIAPGKLVTVVVSSAGTGRVMATLSEFVYDPGP